jgi:hypothetical protein
MGPGRARCVDRARRHCIRLPRSGAGRLVVVLVVRWALLCGHAVQMPSVQRAPCSPASQQQLCFALRPGGDSAALYVGQLALVQQMQRIVQGLGHPVVSRRRRPRFQRQRHLRTRCRAAHPGHRCQGLVRRPGQLALVRQVLGAAFWQRCQRLPGGRRARFHRERGLLAWFTGQPAAALIAAVL